MIELTQEQRASAIRSEMYHQLVIMKQYISFSEKTMYTRMLWRFSSIPEYEAIMLKHNEAYG